MIRWLVQSLTDHPDLVQGHAPPGLLNPTESHRLASFQVEKRRRDWLLGRWTAKQLLQAYLVEGSPSAPSLESLIIENDADGAPFATLDMASEGGSALRRLPVTLSISHAQGKALCALHPSQVENQQICVGADIEYVEARSQRFIEDYFTRAEIHCIQTTDAALRDMVVTAIWSAKESVLKALRTGLRADTRSVSIKLCPPPAHLDDLTTKWIPLEIEIQPQLGHHISKATTFSGWWRVLNGSEKRPNYAITLAIKQDLVI